MAGQDREIARIAGAHELGLAFVKSSILINGGAFVVVLGYMATSSDASLVVFSLGGLRIALSSFLIGIGSVMLALIISYVYSAPNDESSIKHWLDNKVIPINAALCILSLCAFIVGVVSLIVTTSLSA